MICIDVAREPTWDESAYQGDGVHPTVAGNKVLASLLAKAVTNKSAEVVARLEPVGSLRRIRKGAQCHEEGYHS